MPYRFEGARLVGVRDSSTGRDLTRSPHRLNPSLRPPEWYKDWTEDETKHLWLEFAKGPAEDGPPPDANAAPDEQSRG